MRSKVVVLGEIQEIPSKVLLTFWGGLLIRGLHYTIHTDPMEKDHMAGQCQRRR